MQQVIPSDWRSQRDIYIISVVSVFWGYTNGPDCEVDGVAMRFAFSRYAFVAGLILASCGGSSGQEPAASSSPVQALATITIRVGISGESVFEAYKAISGEFDDAPYDIELVKFDSSSDSLEALSAGAIDVAHFLQAPTVVLAQGNAAQSWTAESAPIAIVAAWSNPDHPGFCLVVKDPEIATVADLEGKKVAYSKGSVGQFYFDSIVEEAGLTGVESVQLPPPEGRSAFLSGAVDALVTVYRTAVTLEQEGDGRIIDTSSRIMDYYQVSAVQRSLAEDPAKVAVVRDLIVRSDRAAKWAQDHTDEVVAFNVEQGILDEKSAELVAKYEPRRFVPFVGEFSTWMDRMAKLFLQSGVISSDVDTSVLFDDSFASDVMQSP